MKKCPNCGASINKDAAVVFCEFCGTKITRKRDKKGKDNTKANELYEQAIYQFRFGQFDQCQRTLFKALRQDPYNSDLLLMDAILKNDVSQLHQINKAALSSDVVKMCRPIYNRRAINIEYRVDFNELEKLKINQLNSFKVNKHALTDMPEVVKKLAFAKIFLDEKGYEEYHKHLENHNNAQYVTSAKIFSEWKRTFRYRFYWSLAWFGLAVMNLIIFVNAASIFNALVLGFIGLSLFNKRKKYRPV